MPRAAAQNHRRGLARLFPVLDWAPRYRPAQFADDAIAALIVTAMLIPQSLAYALLAGLPPEIGLYASVAPLLAYAALGTSGALAVGPVAVISLMTATAVGRVADGDAMRYLAASAALAILVGGSLIALGLLRLGALANALSHPVISGFISASGVLIAAGQFARLIGVNAEGDTLPEVARSAAERIGEANAPTAIVGVSALAFLVWARQGLGPLLRRLGAPARAATLGQRAGPVFAVVATTLAVALFDLKALGVAVLGDIPAGLPPLRAPALERDAWLSLAGPALLIAVIGFVESISVAQTLAAKRRERIDPDQELLALGGANVAAGLTGGLPVAGGFARSAVNFDAGAATPAAGAMTAIGVLLVAMFLTPLIADLPKATLAAAIIVAVLSLVDVKAFGRIFRYSKSDGAAMAATAVGVLLFGVETGVLAGVALSLALHIRRTSRPHVAVIGQAPGTEHFRNVARHDVVTSDKIVSLRIDESVYFANARFLEDEAARLVAASPQAEHFILNCSAVNSIDASGLEALEAINERLHSGGVRFHLAEVKGPVMDRLKRSDFLNHLSGEVFMTQYGAVAALDPDAARRALSAAPAAPFAAERAARPRR